MACHEIASLRLGLANLLGDRPKAEMDHDRTDCAVAIGKPGPLKSLSEAQDLSTLRQLFAQSRIALEKRLGQVQGKSAEGYVKTLTVVCKQVDLDLERLASDCERFYQHLDVIHDHLHGLYPAEKA